MPKTTHQFRVVIEQDEDGYFVASVPALPGCYTQARDLDTLRKRVREAILLCLDIANRDPQYRRRLKAFAYEPTFVGVETVRV